MKKKTLLGLLALLILAGCGTSKSGSLKSVSEKIVADREVTLLAVNDMHAAIDNFPRFAFMVDSLRALYPDMLLVTAGDNQTGNPINDQFQEKGWPMIELMNAVRFDLSAVGNHEFDVGVHNLERHTRDARFDFLCANLTPPEGVGIDIKPHKVITLPNGVRVVFTSVLHLNNGGIPDTHPDNVKGFSFQPPLETAKALVHLRDSGDLFIMLNHFGFEGDVEVAQAMPPGTVHLIIGGHSHTRVEKEQIHNGIMITQAENKLKYATLIRLAVRPDGEIVRSMQLLPVGKVGSERADIRAMVDEYNKNPRLREKIAEATEAFTSYEQVGYLMVDAVRAATGADIALTNPGGVRIDHLPKGDVSVLDVYSMDPFGNDVVLFKLTGNEIRALMLSAFELDERLPIYPSGMHTRYLLADDGALKDVVLQTTQGTKLDMDRVYSVAMNSYMASVYRYEHQDPGTSLFRPSAESIIGYLRELQKIPSYGEEKRVFFSN